MLRSGWIRVASRGSVTGSTVIIGIPQEKADELVRDAKRPLEELTTQQRENIVLLKDKLDLNEYQVVALRAFVVQLGDWIFKVPPFAESVADDEAYLDYVRGETSEREIINAARMRSLVPEFLEAAADELLAGSPRIIGFSSVFQ